MSALMKRADRMSVNELAKALGKRHDWVRDELRRDSKCDIPRWPFATSKQGDTGRWSYVINRTQFEKWHSGDGPAINYEYIADLIVERLVARLDSKGA